MQYKKTEYRCGLNVFECDDGYHFEDDNGVNYGTMIVTKTLTKKYRVTPDKKIT